MMRAPDFRYHAARSARDAAAALRDNGPSAMLLAGGTDLVPNMKRRTQTPELVVGLRGIAALRRIHHGTGLTIGACATLADVAAHRTVARGYRALAIAAGSVATPQLRNMGTIGGNLCLDTRCTYYDQSHEWREAIGFCMKAPGSNGGRACTRADGASICWVATSSPRCWAVSSTDTAPALVALGAEVTLLGVDGERRIPLVELYHNDGMAYLTKRADEVLTQVHLPPADARWRSTYLKLRRRGSFDFPVLSVAAAIRLDAAGVVAAARVVLGAVASSPIVVSEATSLVGTRLGDDDVAAFADAASAHARPLDNTDFALGWRKKMAKHYVAMALRELGGGPEAPGAR
jgi:4-hydroxybenzoyl-CoA reductase subunit beta